MNKKEYLVQIIINEYGQFEGVTNLGNLTYEVNNKWEKREVNEFEDKTEKYICIERGVHGETVALTNKGNLFIFANGGWMEKPEIIF